MAAPPTATVVNAKGKPTPAVTCLYSHGIVIVTGSYVPQPC
jgi:hypothetical protein